MILHSIKLTIVTLSIAQAYNPSALEVELGVSHIQGWPGGTEQNKKEKRCVAHGKIVS